MAGYEDLIALVERAQDLLCCKENSFIEKFHNLKSFNCDSVVTKEFNNQKIDEYKEACFRSIYYIVVADYLAETKKNRIEVEQKITIPLKEVDDSTLKSKQPKKPLNRQWYTWFFYLVNEIAFEMVLEENKDASPKNDELILFTPFTRQIETFIKKCDPFNGKGTVSTLTEKLSIVVCEEIKALADLDPLFSETVEELVQSISRIEGKINVFYVASLFELSRIKREEILDAAGKLFLDDNENLTRDMSNFNKSYSNKENEISEYYRTMPIFVPIFLGHGSIGAESSPFLEFSGDFDLLIKNLRKIIESINFAEVERFSIDELKQLRNSSYVELQRTAIKWLGSFILECKDFSNLGGKIRATEIQKKKNCEFVEYIDTLRMPVGDTDDRELQAVKSLIVQCASGCPKFKEKIEILSLSCKASITSAACGDKSGMSAFLTICATK